MKILIINAGSSSLKFSLYEYEKKISLISGIIEKIKEKKSIIKASIKNGPTINIVNTEIKSHKEAIIKMFDILKNK